MRLACNATFANGAFSVRAIPVLKDNFSYLIHDKESNTSAIVDAVESSPIIRELKHSKLENNFIILTTHKHWDHSGANKEFAEKYGNYAWFKIYGGTYDHIPAATHHVKGGDTFNIGSLQVNVLFTPCHTSGHVLYHVFHPTYPAQGALFTGDTIFVGGVGAFFEGNAQDMINAIDAVIQLPHFTAVYPGHEYTVNFMKFSAGTDKNDKFIQSQLKKYEAQRVDGKATVPSTIEEEYKQNLFFRFRDKHVRKLVGVKEDCTDVEAMEAIYNLCP